jgi:hypothetical protein
MRPFSNQPTSRYLDVSGNNKLDKAAKNFTATTAYQPDISGAICITFTPKALDSSPERFQDNRI